jgi:hypothetical protein
LLFPSPKTGGHLDPPAVARKLKTLLKRAGIDEIRFHDLRHTFATISLQSGVNVKALSHNLGHYSAGFTFDTYTHVTTQMQAEAAEKIGVVHGSGAGVMVRQWSGNSQARASQTPIQQALPGPQVTCLKCPYASRNGQNNGQTADGR